MFAHHLSNNLEVLCREFFGELPGGVPAASLRHRDAMRGNQDRPVFQVAHAKRTSGPFLQTVTRLSKPGRRWGHKTWGR